jgi:hypothetical protein
VRAREARAAQDEDLERCFRLFDHELATECAFVVESKRRTRSCPRLTQNRDDPYVETPFSCEGLVWLLALLNSKSLSHLRDRHGF